MLLHEHQKKYGKSPVFKVEESKPKEQEMRVMEKPVEKPIRKLSDQSKYIEMTEMKRSADELSSPSPRNINQDVIDMVSSKEKE